MRTGMIAAIAGIAASAFPAHSEEVKSVDSPLCKQIAMKVAENTKANFVRFNTQRNAVVFAHPMSNDIWVHCSSRYYLNVALSTSSPFPNDLWFYLAAEAAAAMSTSQIDELEKTLRSCHKDALKEDGSPGYGSAQDVAMECYVYASEPVSMVTIYLNDSENRRIHDKATD